MERRLVPAVSTVADAVAYSRAVRVGDRIAIAGTAPIMAGDADPPPDAYGQARRCLEIVVAALRELGAGPEHVVRTRMYLTAADDFDEVARAHREVFHATRPATSALVVAALVDPRWRVEIEADAIVG